VTAPPLAPVSLGWLVKGYRRALARFDATVRQRDPEERFIPLFEALNWVAAITDFQQGLGIHDDTVRGLRFVRNRVHHQWADALEARDVPFAPGLVTVAGAGRPRIVGPPTVVDWFWRPLSQIPAAPPAHANPAGEKAYAAHLEGEPARKALAHLDGLLPP
jgi:hypothetical protein